MHTSSFLNHKKNKKAFSGIVVDVLMYLCFILIVFIFFVLLDLQLGTNEKTIGTLAKTGALDLRLQTILQTPVLVMGTEMTMADLILLADSDKTTYAPLLKEVYEQNEAFWKETNSESVFYYHLRISRQDSKKEEDILLETQGPAEKMSTTFPTTTTQYTNTNLLRMFGQARIELRTISQTSFITITYTGYCDTCTT